MTLFVLLQHDYIAVDWYMCSVSRVILQVWSRKGGVCAVFALPCEDREVVSNYNFMLLHLYLL